ncbi:MAG: rRNA maturation RNase YbeY [Lactobacillales bacterium]|jgi:probable rRNA maturation factor|nr:rRNA maturation RNase YbeY [Lactobacillales bacterium]
MYVYFEDESHYLTDDEALKVQDVLAFAASKLQVDEDAAMSVIIVDNEEIHRINKEYRDIDRATDVISFAAHDDPDDFAEMDAELSAELALDFGDIYISWEKAYEQAKEFDHSRERELGFLAIHGLLHLLGYDHMEEADEREMFELQKELLEDYGLTR